MGYIHQETYKGMKIEKNPNAKKDYRVILKQSEKSTKYVPFHSNRAAKTWIDFEKNIGRL